MTTPAALQDAQTGEKLSEEIKVRLKPSQRRALMRVAAKKGHNEASLARHAIVEHLIAEGEGLAAGAKEVAK